MNKKPKGLFSGVDHFVMLRILTAIGIALVIISAIVFLVSSSPLTALGRLFLGPISTPRNFIDVLCYMVPLVFTGLAMNIVFKAGLFNMGADGAFYMGAVIAAVMAVLMNLPFGVFQVVIICSAALVGGAINTLPALIKRYTGANETVVSLMFNYVFFFLGLFIMNKTILDTSTGNQSFPFNADAKIPKIFERYALHWGFYVMLLTVVIMYFVVSRSKFGYMLRITGTNRRYAKYSGIKVGAVVILSQFIGGVLAGMGGSIQMLGMFNRFHWNLQVMYVWDGVLVNILAGGNPIMVPVSAFFLSFLRIGADVMSRNTDVDSEIISIIQGIIILLISSERFLYTIRKRREERIALENSMLERSQAQEGGAA